MHIIIDEGISETSDTYKCLLQWLGMRSAEFLFLSKEHPGIPDVEIIDKLLPKYQFLVTKDRVLHNRALAKGYTSFFLDKNGNLTIKPLRGIQLNKSQPPSIRKEIQDNYIELPSDEVREITFHLKSALTEQCIEKIRTKRRRIRSYFADIANIASVDFTIGSEKSTQGAVGGFVLKIDARQHLKALKNASEGYCLDRKSAHILSPVFYALSHLYCLQLTHVPVTLYITSPEVLVLCQHLTTAQQANDPIEHAVQRMLHHLTKATLMPCVKGPFFERMQNKLMQMKSMKTNELVTIDCQAMAAPLMNFRAMLGD